LSGNEVFEYAKSVNEQAIATSNAVLRALLTIHGGSAVALLAFVGSLAGHEKVDMRSVILALRAPLELFGWGVAVSVLAMMFAYFTNYATVGHTFAEAESTQEKRYGLLKSGSHIAAILLAFTGLGLFLCAVRKVSVAVSLISF
jgi:hypothetical protein